jgi:hypothetical protein
VQKLARVLFGGPGPSECGSDVSKSDTSANGEAGSWQELLDEELLTPPTEVTTTPVDPLLDLLPTHEMTWQNFESLLKRMAREVQGLRAVWFYGVLGQAQHGIDLAGVNPAGENEAIQGKKYQKFTVGDLDKAVLKYLDGALPFVIRRLAVGVSCQANDKEVVERLVQLNEQHEAVEFELWDRVRLSEMLRGRPDIVREFFGEMTAVRFCGRYATAPQPVPRLDAVAVADAVMRGPAEASGADKELAAAARDRGTNPARAADHVKAAQRLLREAGFAAHARVLDSELVDILGEGGETPQAALLLAESVWSALREDDTDRAAHLTRQLAALAAQADIPEVHSLHDVADAAVASSRHPLGQAPDLTVLKASVPPLHQARLLLLAGETELAQGNAPFGQDIAARARDLLAGTPDLEDALAVRLELCIAESTGNWSPLLSRARTRKIARPLAALVLARHARHLADHADPDGADAEWNEAVEQACLAQIYGDAANWLYSQRMLANRYRPVLSDPYGQLASALSAEPGQPSVTGAAPLAREHALEALQQGKLREAAIRLQRYLRDSAASGSWVDEHIARRMLADVLMRSGEPRLTAHHLILAGLADTAHDLGLAAEQYMDVTVYLDQEPYWVKASTLRLIAAEADLVPNEQVDGVAEQALAVLDQVSAGELRDAVLFAPSADLAAHEVLAALSERLTLPRAARLLDILEPLTAVDRPDAFRYTDESHALACSGIGRTHLQLAERAVDQLLSLLERAAHSVPASGLGLIADHLAYSRARLERQRDAGGIAATDLLAGASPDAVTPEAAEEAAAALMSPTASRPGNWVVGTDAVYRANLARQLPPDRRAEIIHAQLERCRSSHEAALNRREYLLAAANLTDALPDNRAGELFGEAISLIRDSSESEMDRADRGLAHPLGALRVRNNVGDERPAGAFLAALLARGPEQKKMARDTALQLIGGTDDGDYWCTRALQALTDDLTPDFAPVLATLGWPLRSLAAIIWSRSEEVDSNLGLTLARDADQRVRRALAQALSAAPASTRTSPARRQLSDDVRFSVRSALAGKDNPPPAP